MQVIPTNSKPFTAATISEFNTHPGHDSSKRISHSTFGSALIRRHFRQLVKQKYQSMRLENQRILLQVFLAKITEQRIENTIRTLKITHPELIAGYLLLLCERFFLERLNKQTFRHHYKFSEQDFELFANLNVEDHAISTLALKRLLSQLRKSDPLAFQVLVARYMGLTLAEIANRTQLSIQSVRTVIKNIKKQLAKTLT